MQIENLLCEDLGRGYIMMSSAKEAGGSTTSFAKAGSVEMTPSMRERGGVLSKGLGKRWIVYLSFEGSRWCDGVLFGCRKQGENILRKAAGGVTMSFVKVGNGEMSPLGKGSWMINNVLSEDVDKQCSLQRESQS